MWVIVASVALGWPAFAVLLGLAIGKSIHRADVAADHSRRTPAT